MIPSSTVCPLERPELESVGFFPRPDDPGYRAAPGAEDHLFSLGDGTILRLRLYWALPKDPVILYFHGNGETARDYDDQARLYQALPSTLAVADYRGYGLSTGKPTWKTLLPDATYLLMELQKVLAIRGFAGPVLVMGRSLGSAPAIHLASQPELQLAGLIVESGFAAMVPLLELMGVPARRLGVTEEMGPANLEKMRRVNRPTLILHAEQDDLIPIRDAELLYEVSPDVGKELLRVPFAGHNDILARAGRTYHQAIARLLRRGEEAHVGR
jgi:pimeloyl-ACP methyl ester carboxylesterase